MEQATPRRGVLTPTLIRAGLSDIKRSPDSLRHSYVQLNLEVRGTCHAAWLCSRLFQILKVTHLVTLQPFGPSRHPQNQHLADITAIKTCAHVQKAHLDRNALRSLEPLAALTHLRVLTAADNQLAGAFPDFVGPRALERVDVSGNKISQFSEHLARHSFITHIVANRASLFRALSHSSVYLFPSLHL
jgi:Leucine-rich repeat (LRR) protein